jgi:hypothetical protein
MNRKKTFVTMITFGIVILAATLYFFLERMDGLNSSYLNEVAYEPAEMEVIQAGFTSAEPDFDIEKALIRKNKAVYLASFRRSVDELADNKFYTYKTIPRSQNVNSLHTYILEKGDNFELHLMARHTSSDPLNFDRIIFYVDDEVIEYYPSEKYVREESGKGVYENFDIPVKQPEEAILRKIINSEVAKVSFVGPVKRYDLVLTNNDKFAMERSLFVYNELK